MNLHIDQELKDKELIIMDHHKRNAMLQRRCLSPSAVFCCFFFAFVLKHAH